MKRMYLLAVLLLAVLCFSACNQPQPTIGSKPATKPSTNPTTSATQNTKPDSTPDCYKGHTFVDDSDFCTVCGANYYNVTLVLELADTQDYYIVTDIGTCQRTVLKVPAMHNGKPVEAIATQALCGTKFKGRGDGYLQCKQITSIILPETIRQVGKQAFAGCVSLESIHIPYGVQEISEEAFIECESLKLITFSEGLQVIGESAFSLCVGLEEISLPDSLSVIGDTAFANCWALSEVVIPQNVTQIGKKAFLNCKALSKLELPEGLQVLPEGMIRQCTSLEYIRISAEITEIPEAFARGCSSLKKVELQGNITAVRQCAFMNCGSLLELQLPETVVCVEKDAFAGCTSLYQVYEGMAYVGNDENPYMIFLGKSDQERTDVLLHNDTRMMADHSLYDSDVTSLIFGEKMAVIDGAAIRNLRGVKTVGVAPGNSRFHCAGNCIIETETKTLIRGCADSVIPDDGSVTIIGGSAFSGLEDVTNIVIPDSITEIGANAFIYCDTLKFLVIGSGVRRIGREVLLESKNCTCIYYNGTYDQWNQILNYINGSGFGNKELKEAILYCYSETPPTEEGNYWRYVDGVPTPWEEEA